MTPWKIIVLIVATLANLYISRKSLRQPQSHGFYRFFAWEAILLLFLLNLDRWFVEPGAPHQVLSWILLFGSLVPVIWGTLLLKRRGQAAETRPAEPELLAFEKTTCLVTTGIYKYIRHPLYSSLLLLAWGIFFKSPTYSGAALAVGASAFLLATARADEAECLKFFGQPYQDYMRKTKRFIPFIF